MLAAFLLWILGIHSIHCLLILSILLTYIGWKVYQTFISPEKQLRLHHERALRRVFVGMVRRGRSVIMRPTKESPSITSATTTKKAQSSSYSYHLAIALLLIIPSSKSILCADQDAAILEPLAELAKSIVATITLGVPIEINMTAGDIAKNFAALTWRTGFPVTMPRGFMEKAQNFFNKIKLRVDESNVTALQRKSLPQLKVDLDDIIDGIVEHVRQSYDGVYADYTLTMVNGIPLEEACVSVGKQLKAYGIDIKNYRNIAGMILGIPIVPHLAQGVVAVADMVPSVGTVTNLTTKIALMPVNHLPVVTQHVVGTVRSLSPI